MLDKLVLGLQVTLIGLVIVFVMLFLIIAVIKLLALIISSAENKSALKAQKKKLGKEDKKSSLNENKAVEKPAASAVEEDAKINADACEEEIIAVLAAACAAVIGTEPSNVVVRSYKKVRRTAWASAGRREQMM